MRVLRQNLPIEKFPLVLRFERLHNGEVLAEVKVEPYQPAHTPPLGDFRPFRVRTMYGDGTESVYPPDGWEGTLDEWSAMVDG